MLARVPKKKSGGMLLLAKVVISSAIVSEELGLYGLPGAFLLTAPLLHPSPKIACGL